jgi:hypothetical protein
MPKSGHVVDIRNGVVYTTIGGFVFELQRGRLPFSDLVAKVETTVLRAAKSLVGFVQYFSIQWLTRSLHP